jgi:hypothetical protein
MKLIAGCKYITKSVQNSKVFGSHFLKFSESKNDEVGEQVAMPNPSINPIKVIHNTDNVLLELAELELKWAKLDRLDRYGVYHSIIALFGDKHWVTKDRAGGICLRIYESPFT